MLSASETDRTTVEARPRAEVEQLLEDNLQLKRHKLEEASTCDGVVKLIKRYDRDRHATLDELNAGLEGIISRRKKLRRESHIRDDWEAEVVALQAQVHADGPRYKRLRNIKQKIAADLERDKQQVKLRQAPVDETTAPRPPHSVSVTPLELKFWENGKVDAKDTSLADLKALELGDHPKEAITRLRGLKKGRRELKRAARERDETEKVAARRARLCKGRRLYTIGCAVKAEPHAGDVPMSFRGRDLRNGFYDPETKDHGGLPIDGLGRRVRRRRRGPRADLWYRVGDSSL